MSRVIKCRGKNNGSGEWVYGVPVKTFWYGTETLRMIEDGEIYGGETEPIFDSSIDPQTVGQFTGLLDKNGVEIYEGDLVKNRSGRISKVVWLSSDCWAMWDLDAMNCKGKPSVAMWRDIEIIGNIHT